LEVHEADYHGNAFETLPAGDQTVVVALDGSWTVESFRDGAWRKVVYVPGSAGLTPPQGTSRLRLFPRGSTRPHRTAHLYVPQPVLEEAAEEYRRIGVSHRENPLSVLCVDDPILVHGVNTLKWAMDVGAPDLYASSVIHWLARHLLLRHAQHVEPREASYFGTVTDVRLARVVEFMTAHYAMPVTLDMLAKEAGISKFHFVRVFREALGQTPHSMLVSIRLNAAARLLVSTALRIEEIASDCGYARVDHFGAAFRRRHGMSPRRYRTLKRR
jgi:AraC family transcriptional regulator